MALAVDEPLDDFDRVATERAALAVAIDLLGQQHEEHLRARSRGAFLSDLADGRVEEADARRRAEALGLNPGAPNRGRAAAARGELARAALAARRGAVVDAAVGRAARGAVVDRVRRAARPARRRPARPARARRPQLRRGAGRACRRAVPRRAGAARRRASTWRRWRSARRPRTGRRPARVCAASGARREPPPRCPPRRWYDARRPGVTDLLHDLRDAPELDAFVDEQLGPLLANGSPRHRAAARDARGVPRRGRPQGAGGARAAPRAPVALPAAAPDRGAARRLARRRGRRPRPASRGPRARVPPAPRRRLKAIER